ncbi:MAG: hypothetical protein ABWZ40_00915 [Caulobacterales bacterium]
MADAAAPASESAPEEMLRLVIRAAWLAILLGLGVQIAVVLTKGLLGGKIGGAQFLVDCAQGLTWSVLVCGAVTIGIAASKGRGALMGLLGLVSAPIAWAAAKGAQKGVQSLVGLPEDSFNAFFFMLSAVKALEYLALGILVGGLTTKPDAKFRDFVFMGARIGLITAAIVYRLQLDRAAAAGETLNAAKTGVILVNETLFPIGCAVIVGLVAHVKDYVAKLQSVTPAPSK